MSDTDLFALVERAQTLAELGRAAEAAGLRKQLNRSLDDVIEELERLGYQVHAAVREASRRRLASTLGELLAASDPATGPRWRASRKVREELMEELRLHLLSYLGEPEEPAGEPEKPAGERAGVRPGPPVLRSLPGGASSGGPPAPACFPDRASALEFARASEIEGALRARATVLYPTGSIPADRMLTALPTVLETIVPEAWLRAQLLARLGARGTDELRSHASNWLRTQARIRAAALAPERAYLARPWRAHAPAAQPFLDRLRACREAHLGKVPPLAPAATERVEPQVDRRVRFLRIAVHSPSVELWDHVTTGQVQVPIDEGELTCSCPARHCLHRVAAIDLLVPFLTSDSPAGARIAAIAAIPAWQFALERLDDALPPPAATHAASRLAFRLTDGRGGLGLVAVLQSPRKGGGFTTGAKLQPGEGLDAPGISQQERRALAALHRSAGWKRGPQGHENGLASALAELVGHPLVFLGNEAAPIAVRRSPLTFNLRAQPDGGFVLEPSLGGFVPKARELLSVVAIDGLAAVLDAAAGVCHVTEVDDAARPVLRALCDHRMAFPPEAAAALAARADRLGSALSLELPESLLGTEVPADLRLRLRLEALPGAALGLSLVVCPAPGGPAFPPGEGPVRLPGQEDGRRVFVRRELEAELARRAELIAALGLRPDAELEGGGFLLDRGEEALDLLGRLDAGAPAGAVVEWAGAARTILRAAGPSDLRITVTAQRDWFGLAGLAAVDGAEVQLAILLDAARRGRRYVEVSGGAWLPLSQELRARLAATADRVHEGKGGISVPLAGAEAVETLAEGGVLDAAPAFLAFRRRVRSAERREPELPALTAELRPYQVEGFRWLARLAAWGAGGCLADDMGLGKTLQALALLTHRAGSGPALVVAPTSVVGNWLREAARFAPELKLTSAGALGVKEREQALGELGKGDVLVTSWALLVRDAEQLAAIHFGTLVLDEAQAVKNPATRRAKAARALDAGARFALTGTPVENHLGELHSLLSVLVPGLLGSFEQFRERFGLPIERDRDPLRQAALSAVIRPFLLRRTKAQVAPELPSRTEIDAPVTLAPEERRLYEEARLAAAAEVSGLETSLPPEKRRFAVLAALTRLRLCACHPRLYDPRSKLPSSKLLRLVELVTELKEEGHKALVFSQFTKHLDLVEPALAAAGLSTLRLDGSTPMAARQRLVDAFQAGDADVFLISLKAGGTGLNLTAADYVIHLDPWWNPAVEDQATDRAHRIGQQRPVTVLRLVARGTIEEQILSLHAGKRALVASILEGAGAAGKLDTAALAELIRAGGAVDEESDDVGDEPAAAGPGEQGTAPALPSAAATLPRCLGRSAEEILALPQRLRRALEEEQRRGLINTGPVKSYPRAVERFARWIAEGAPVAIDAPFEMLRQGYLAAVRSGDFPAPQSEPILAATALRRLERLLAEGGGG